MQITGDSNATFKDLTRIVEAEILEPIDPLYPLICSDVESADEAYIKIPIQSRVAFPTQFTGEREPSSTEVVIDQQYNKATYTLTLDYDSDTMRESKAYTFSEKTQEGTMSAKIFPNYNLTVNVIQANGLAYDGIAFYGTGHSYAKSGLNTFDNRVTATGTTVTALYNDLQTAVAKLKTFKDGPGRLLNPNVKYGANQLVIHCPAALEVNFRQILFGSQIPVTSPVTTSGGAAMSATAPKLLEGMNGIATLQVDGYLDSAPTTWYLHYIGMPQKPFIYTQSYGIQSIALGFGSEFETNKGKVRIAMKQRFVEGMYRFDRSIRVA